jgi:cell division protein FtsN
VGEKYFEIIITARQLAALLAGVVMLVAVAFGVGVAVGKLEPREAPVQVVVAEPLPTPFATQPVVVPTVAPPPTPTAAPVPTERPTPAPVATAAPVRATPTRAAAASPSPSAGAATGAVPRWVQVVVVSKPEQAEGARQRVIALGYTGKQAVVQPLGGGKFRVRVGPFPDEESAGRVAARLRAQGFTGAFLVKPGE